MVADQRAKFIASQGFFGRKACAAVRCRGSLGSAAGRPSPRSRSIDRPRRGWRSRKSCATPPLALIASRAVSGVSRRDRGNLMNVNCSRSPRLLAFCLAVSIGTCACVDRTLARPRPGDARAARRLRGRSQVPVRQLHPGRAADHRVHGAQRSLAEPEVPRHVPDEEEAAQAQIARGNDASRTAHD